MLQKMTVDELTGLYTNKCFRDAAIAWLGDLVVLPVLDRNILLLASPKSHQLNQEQMDYLANQYKHMKCCHIHSKNMQEDTFCINPLW